ncbi:MAG: hypothetical protein ACI4BI_04620 [Anaerotardibacter sp.]
MNFKIGDEVIVVNLEDNGSVKVGVNETMRIAYQDNTVLVVKKSDNNALYLSDGYWYKDTMLQHANQSEDDKFRKLLLN